MTAKKRILFVDDDPMILASLRSLFRRERGRWDMVFVNNGEEALVELGRAPFDLVVSDMRMPGIDGLQLLEQVRESSPHTLRVMLSGSTETQDEQTASTVHVLLGKPCEPAILRSTLDRLMLDAECVV